MAEWTGLRSAVILTIAATAACGEAERGVQPHQEGSTGGAESGGASANGASPGTAGAMGGRSSGAAGGSAGRATGEPTGGASSGEGGEGGRNLDPCESPALAEAPLFRLTHAEFDNTVRDLLGVDDAPATHFPSELRGMQGLGALSSLLIEQYHDFAHDFALKATSDVESLRRISDCDVATQGEDECRQRLLDVRIARLLRRPLDAEDETDFNAVFAQGVELGGGFAGGVRAVLEVALQSPEFLYRVEFGEPLGAPAGDPRAEWGRPTPFEMASRLSYLFWNSAPDDELVQAAARGGLRSRDEISEQAHRLLGDERAKRMARQFYVELFQLAQSQTRPPESRLTPEVFALLLRETELLVDDVTFGEPGDFASLLTTPTTWVNAKLASYYGIPGVTGDDFVRVELDGSRRAGILTQGSFLVAHASEATTNPFNRGRAVLEELLCEEVPPEGALPLPVVPEPPRPNATTRERWEAETASPQCAPCHAQPNGIGFAFEHYDQWGLWRETENGLPIDASGELTVKGAEGHFDGAIELARLIAASPVAKSCFAGKWLAYAYGRALGETDACSRNQVEQAFAEGRIRDLLLAIPLSDAFLYRPLAAKAP